MANLRSVRKPSDSRGKRDRERDREPLAIGQVLLEDATGRQGQILDAARQYAHPQAAPVFVYLVRWDDGQVQSLSEHALKSGQGIDLLDS